ncbi:hypothetical protein [Chondrinema litorale]|uniref:hypothetical protein n=1 Tax=Chondrinema litorale TaxID=2994555 RepID=UPI0025428F1A|nr:hypothetical protein [Chondrinema litorale]UZR97416.1 hypothetical protein OQ292_26775 [Chondrinema litorale]
MKKLFLLLLSLVCFSAYSQNSVFNAINYSSLDYKILNRDTLSYSIPQPDSTGVDSMVIYASLVYPNLPFNFDNEQLSLKTKQIMQDDNIQFLYIWRDEKALWMLPISRRTKEMIEIEKASFIGTMELANQSIRIRND